MGVDDGETLHGFRAGCAITLALKGAALSEIMDYVGWTRRHTALYYSQLAKVLNPEASFARLSSAEEVPAVNYWQDIIMLKRFVCAFLLSMKGSALMRNHDRVYLLVFHLHHELESWVRVGGFIGKDWG